jgi:hypothetical protein
MPRHHRRLILTFASLTILAANAGVASAQLTTGTPSTDTFNNYLSGGVSSPGTFTHFNLNVTDASTSNYVDLKLTGDWDFRLPRLPGSGQVRVNGFLPFSVGNVPVQIDDYGITTDAKWVNGGGAAAIPSTFMHRFTAIVERLSPADQDGPMVAASSIEDELDGNGLRIFHMVMTSGAPSSYVLAANTDYLLLSGVITQISNQTFDPFQTPTITVTNEFGGDLGDSYSGFDATFAWHPVPEPSSIALAGIGLASLGFVTLRKKFQRVDRLRPRRS